MKKNSQSKAAILRHKAEELLFKKPSALLGIRKFNQPISLSDNEKLKLIHELEVSQIELELQNEEFRLAQSAAQDAAEKYAELYDFAPSGYFTLSNKGIIIELNLSGANMLGKERSHLKNNLFSFFVSDDTKPIFKHFLEEVFNNEVKETCEVILSNNGNLPMYVYLTGIATKNREQCFVIITDITLRVQAEEKLRESEFRFKQVSENAQELIWEVDKNGLYTYANPVIKDLIGYELEEIVGKKHFYDLFDQENREEVKQGILGVFARKESFKDFVNINLHKDGRKIILATSAIPMLDSRGNLIGYRGVDIDITERINAEESIRKQKEEFETIFNLVPAQIWYKDTHNNFIRVNHQVCTDIGMTNDKIEGHSAEELFPSFAQQYFKDDLEVFNTHMPKLGIIEQVNTSKGKIRWVHSDKIPMFGNDGEVNGLIAFVHDITEHKLAEKEISILTQSLRSVNECVSITDFDDKIIFVNESFLKTYGYDENELIGKHISIVRSLKNPPELVNKILPATKLGVWSGELINTRKDGNEFPIYLSTTIISDKDGKPLGLIGVASDITKRKLVEKELIEAKENAEESDRLKTSFLNNISHEIRTPFNGLLGFLSLIQDNDLPASERDEYISIINKSAYRLMNTINDIVEISQIQAGQMKMIVSKTSIHESVSELYIRFKSDAEGKGLKFSINNDLPNNIDWIYTDSIKLNAILSNLIGNAIKFTNKGSIVFGIKLKSVGEVGIDCRDKACLVSTSTELEFSVKDTGIGISENKQQAIFERFMQADGSNTRLFEGSGLGLSIAKAYVEMLNGEIWVVSEEGKGSTFYFTIPYKEEPEEKNDIKNIVMNNGAENQNNPEVLRLKILIAEDDEESAMLLTIGVRSFGREVIKVRTGSEAVEACRNNPDIDLILMDIKMPDMDGYEATRQIREFNNDVVIIAQTAYALIGDREKAIEAGCNDYIAKPFSRATLVALIEKHFKKQEK